MGRTVAVILAAGQGKRMRSALAKVLHPVAGRPMIRYVLDAALEAGVDAVVVVVGRDAERVQEACVQAAAERRPPLAFALQEEQLGTGHAVLQARPHVGEADRLLVLYGDTPLIEAAQIRALLDAHAAAGAAATLLTAVVADPTGYGRVVRGGDGAVLRIVEEKDATEEERRIQEINTGIGCFTPGPLWEALQRVEPRNAQGEYYLTDVVALLRGMGHRTAAVPAADAEAVLGVNDRAALAEAGAVLRRRRLLRLMREGVTVVDPATTFVDADVEVGEDTVILPFTILEGRTRVGRGCRLGPGSHLIDSELADGVTVMQSVVEESRIAEGVRIGPFAHVRPGCEIGPGAEIGNYAEVKKSRLGAGVKAHHHSYIGDAVIGDNVNVGAGLVTVNYDGRRKHVTVVEAGAFLGCNVNLVAPVTVGRDAYVAAGSTVTEPVPPGALAIARERQVNKEGWVERARSRPAGDGSA
ncbi:MAG: bifunctional UDP-N-acetylglucosamine diphosphorylase/glucosamine-1-phosphate N-acetyltransferase GlmU [Firmicutes bacterium]|nr:bifunctional UDP-N-acetylglucosamine diphosphorylase/glucosamine-1-phosphate N-acetyltransferase GlmU [Bacillota bacterium]